MTTTIKTQQELLQEIFLTPSSEIIPNRFSAENPAFCTGKCNGKCAGASVA